MTTISEPRTDGSRSSTTELGALAAHEAAGLARPHNILHLHEPLVGTEVQLHRGHPITEIADWASAAWDVKRITVMCLGSSHHAVVRVATEFERDMHIVFVLNTGKDLTPDLDALLPAQKPAPLPSEVAAALPDPHENKSYLLTLAELEALAGVA